MDSLDYSGVSASYFIKLHKILETIDHKSIDRAVSLIAAAWDQGKQIISLGNGGSSLTALHYINDWNKSVFMHGQRPFRGRSLIDNIGLVMAYANDMSFEDMFMEQLRNVLQPGDLLIAISGSGNSENVLRAVRYANENNSVTLGLCGYDGGLLKDLVQHCVWINIDDMQLVEDIHAIFGHIVMQSLCRESGAKLCNR